MLDTPSKVGLSPSSKWSKCEILHSSACTVRVHSMYIRTTEQWHNLCKVDLGGQVLGDEDNVYFTICSIHLIQWIFIVPSILLSSFCPETFNN